MLFTCGAFSVRRRQPAGRAPGQRPVLDSVLLAERWAVELRDLLDPEVTAATNRQLQHSTFERHARDAEGIADLLRLLGPLTEEELNARCAGRRHRCWLEGLRTARRALMVSFAGKTVGVHRGYRLLRDGVRWRCWSGFR